MTGMIPSLFYLYVFGQSQLAKVKEKRAGREMKMKGELLLFVKNASRHSFRTSGYVKINPKNL